MLNETSGRSPTYSGNDVTTAFAYPFKINLSSEIKVVKVSSLGVATTQTLTTHYTLTGLGVSGGGNFVFVSAPATGETVYAIRNQTLAQTTDYQVTVPPETAERSFDNLAKIAQMFAEKFRRVLSFAEKSSSVDMVVDEPVEGQLLRWKIAGGGVDSVPFTETGISLGTTDDLPEGSSNLYYTQARADARVAAGLATHTAGSNVHTIYELTASKGAIHGHAGLGADALVPAAQLGTGSPDSTKALFGDRVYRAVQLLSQKDQANGYAGLNSNTLIPIAKLGVGTPTGFKFLRDDNILARPDGELELGADAGTNTTTIQAAIDALPALGGTVRLPAGSYTVGTTPIEVDKPCTIVGHGSGSTALVPASNVTGGAPNALFNVTIGTADVPVWLNTSVHFKGFAINMGDAGSSDAIAISPAEGTSNWGSTLEDMAIAYGPHGFHPVRAAMWTLIKCHFTNITSAAVWIENLNDADQGDNEIEGCNFLLCALSVLWTSGAGLRFVKNKALVSPFLFSWDAGISSGGCEIADNDFDAYNGGVDAPADCAAIFFDGTPGTASNYESIAITGNFIRGDMYAIRLLKGAMNKLGQITITGNCLETMSQHSGATMIEANGIAGMNITGNFFYAGNTTQALTNMASCTHTTVESNVWTGATLTAPYQGNSYTLVAHARGVAIANLPGVENGSVVYCTDCTLTGNMSVCSGSGTGSVAHRIAGAWRCL